MDKEAYEMLYKLEDSYWWHQGMRQIAFSLLDRVCEEGQGLRILHAGCGTGGMLHHLRRYGSTVGVDLSREAICACTQRGEQKVLRASVNSLPFASQSFDVVTSFDVIYHEAVDDEAALREFQRILNPGGWLLLRVPAYDWLRGAQDRITHTSHRFTRGELAQKLTTVGLCVKRISYCNTLLFPVSLIKRLIIQPFCWAYSSSDLRPLPQFLNGILRSMLIAERKLLRCMDLPFGLSVVALARRR